MQNNRFIYDINRKFSKNPLDKYPLGVYNKM